MTVPALTTSDIATFAYYLQTGCTYVQLADVLPILHSYQQHAEYVDGTIKLWDTPPTGGGYVLVNVRIRADGWIMAWFPRTLMTGTADSGSGAVVTDSDAQIQRNGDTSPGSLVLDELQGYIFKPTSGPLSGNEYTIVDNDATTITLYEHYGENIGTNVNTLGVASYDIIQSRGNLMLWNGGGCNAVPVSQSTRLGRALYELWESLKANQQGGSGAALDYADVGYWDYEFTLATKLYMFGRSPHFSNQTYHYYATIPSAVTIYHAVISCNHFTDSNNVSLEGVTMLSGWQYGYSTMYTHIDVTNRWNTSKNIRKKIDIYAANAAQVMLTT